MLVTGFERADTIASLIVVALMVKASWGLLKTSGRVLLESATLGWNSVEAAVAIVSSLIDGIDRDAKATAERDTR